MRTSMYSILCIVIRLGAVILALRVAAYAVRYVESYKSEAFLGTGYLLGLAMILLMLVLAFLLWLFPGPLARMASSRSHQQIFESPISAYEIQWIAFSVLGVFLVLDGLLELSSWLLDGLWIPKDWDVGEEIRLGRRLEGVYFATQTIFGLALALGAKGLTGVLQRLRYANSSGVVSTSQREPNTSSNDQV